MVQPINRFGLELRQGIEEPVVSQPVRAEVEPVVPEIQRPAASSLSMSLRFRGFGLANPDETDPLAGKPAFLPFQQPVLEESSDLPLINPPESVDPQLVGGSPLLRNRPDLSVRLAAIRSRDLEGLTPPDPQQSALENPVLRRRLDISGRLAAVRERNAGRLGQSAITPTSSATMPASRTTALTQDDAVNFLLAGSKGGTQGTDVSIDGSFANPNSRFANAGANEFDAVVAKLYSEQFKAYALGMDAAFAPGKDINQIAANITRAGNAQFTPEAELLSKVAAVYRGELPGESSTYDNGVLKNLLVKWGRSDLANRPGVGETDVESIGSVVQALNEQKDPAIRQAWLQEIFDFKNNSPVSPSGAVPNAKAYQEAIRIVQNGGLDKLLDNYNKGIKTSGPVEDSPSSVSGETGGPAPKIGDVDFRQLDSDQRTQLSGLDDHDRAVLHLWGRQMSIVGFQNGNIYNTVLEDPSSFKPAEVQLINQLAAKDQQEFGGITGKALDQEFFKVYQKITGVDISSKYGNAPVHFADGVAKFPDGTVDSPEWEAKLEKQNGLNTFENEVLRLWGHNPLFTGKVDGAILPFTLDDNKALDFGVNKNDVRSLLNADLASDGVLNGDSLKNSFVDVLDKVYFNQGGTTAGKVMQQARTEAAQNGRTPQQVMQSMTTGVQQAMSNIGDLMKRHPAITGLTAGGLMAATAVCPFLAGMGAGAVGIGLANMRRGRAIAN